MKLADMGTTGLVDYVNAAPTRRSRKLRYGQASKVIDARYGDRTNKAVARFALAVWGK